MKKLTKSEIRSRTTARAECVLAVMPFGHSRDESQRDSGPKPRVASCELPWETETKNAPTPTGLRPISHDDGTTPVGLKKAPEPRIASRTRQPWAGGRNPFGIRNLFWAASLVLLTAIPVQSQIVFDYVKIADTTTPIPNGTGNFGSFTLPANTGSNVVFYSQAGLQKGIYNSAGGVLTVIADTNTPAHGGQPGRFLMEFDTPTVRGTGVAFYGNSFSGPAIYRSSGGVLEVIASIETPVPDGSGNFGDFFAA